MDLVLPCHGGEGWFGMADCEEGVRMGLRSWLGTRKRVSPSSRPSAGSKRLAKPRGKRKGRFQMFVDERGVPYSDYSAYSVEGEQRSILSVAERGLWYWNEFGLGEGPAPLLSYNWQKWPVNKELAPVGRDAARSMLFNCAGWLLDEVFQKDGFLVWVYPYRFSYDTRPGWRSSHAQAAGMQLLARAALLSQDNMYSAPIDGLLAAFSVPVEHGGVLVQTEGGKPWFEKIADEENEQPRVLNGMMFAVLGLFDIAQLLQKEEPERLAREGLEAVLEQLPRYDLGNWTSYDIFGRQASPHYHLIHIRQLHRLYEITNDSRLVAWRDRFKSYDARLKKGAASPTSALG